MRSTVRPGIWGTLKNWLSQTSKPRLDVPAATGYIEITPSGFISQNYVAYVSGQTKPTSCLEDGTRITKFSNGETITEAASGHLVHVDGHGRIVVVRLLASDIKNAKTGCSADRSQLLTSSFEGGATVTRAMNVLKITRSEHSISVRMPNHTVVNVPLALAPLAL